MTKNIDRFLKKLDKLITIYEKDADFHLDAALYGEIKDLLSLAIKEHDKEILKEIDKKFVELVKRFEEGETKEVYRPFRKFIKSLLEE